MTYKPQSQRLAELLDALDGIELSAIDNRLVGWLSGFDQWTTDAVAALLRKARRGSYPDIGADDTEPKS